VTAGAASKLIKSPTGAIGTLFVGGAFKPMDDGSLVVTVGIVSGSSSDSL